MLLGSDNLVCSKKYKIDFKTFNFGNFTEDVRLVGRFGNFEWDSLKTGLEVGKYTTAGSKTINVSFSRGYYELVEDCSHYFYSQV